MAAIRHTVAAGTQDEWNFRSARACRKRKSCGTASDMAGSYASSRRANHGTQPQRVFSCRRSPRTANKVLLPSELRDEDHALCGLAKTGTALTSPPDRPIGPDQQNRPDRADDQLADPATERPARDHD